MPSKLRHLHQAITSIMLYRYCILHDEQPKPFRFTKSKRRLVSLLSWPRSPREQWDSEGVWGLGNKKKVFLSHKILITDKFLNQLAPTYLCILNLSCHLPKLDIHQHIHIGNFLACLHTWCFHDSRSPQHIHLCLKLMRLH